MKKTVQIVTVPLDKKNWKPNTLCKYIKKDCIYKPYGKFEIDTLGHKLPNYMINTLEYWQAQQLLVLSDDEIQKGDWYLFDSVYIRKDGGYVEDKNHRYKKVIASYPQIEGTLPILSKETVQAWINAGIPGEGSVEIEHETIARASGFETGYDYFKIDELGNLLLEFGSKIDLKEIGEKLKDRVLFPDAHERAKDYLSKVVKPSIPTDEEIEEKAEDYSDIIERHWDEKGGFGRAFGDETYAAYKEGYKQALKDLGHKN